MFSASQYLEKALNYLLENRVKYTNLALENKAKTGTINYDYTCAYGSMITDLKMYLNNKVMKVSAEKQLYNYGNFQNITNAIGCNTNDYPLSAFLKQQLPDIDHYPQPIKQIIIDYCNIYVTNNYTVNNDDDIEFIVAYVCKMLVKVMYLFKFENAKYQNDINELNKLTKPYNVEYYFMSNYAGYCSDITYKIIHANKETRENIIPFIEFLETYYCRIEGIQRIKKVINLQKELKAEIKVEVKSDIVSSNTDNSSQKEIHNLSDKEKEIKTKKIKKEPVKANSDSVSGDDSDSSIATTNTTKSSGKTSKTTKTSNTKKIPAAVRKIVWNTYIGKDNSTGKCLVCSAEDISHTNFECGHVKSRINGGDITIDNLRPICGNCNKSIGGNDMDVFMASFNIKQPENWNGILKIDVEPDNIEKKIVKSKVKKEVLLDKKDDTIEQLQARITEIEMENTALKAEVQLLKLKLSKYE